MSKRVVDADEPGPFAFIGQTGRRREIPELLQNVDFSWKRCQRLVLRAWIDLICRCCSCRSLEARG